MKPEEFIEMIESKITAVEHFMDEVGDSALSIIFQTIPFEEALKLSSFTESELWVYFWEQTTSSEYLENMLAFYKSTTLCHDRIPLIEEAMWLHSNQRFGGSATLFYAQIEGVVTEALKRAKMLRQDGKKLIEQINGADKLNRKSEPEVVTGLAKKLSLAENLNSDLQEYFKYISAYKLIDNDLNSKFSQIRNEVLHGENVEYSKSNKLSIQLSLCMYSLFYSLGFVEFNP